MPIVNTTILGSLAAITGVISAEALDKAIRQGVPAKTEENCRAAAQGYSAVRSGDPVSVSERPSSPVVRMAAALPPAPIASIPSDVIHTASWRTLKPVIRLEGCTKCNFCWKFCPDDAIEFDSVGFPRIREAYCKGCGICAAECPPRVIEMVEEA